MGDIRDKVAIIGMGCVKFGELWDKSSGDMIVDAAYEAYADAGVEPKDIQAGWVGVMYPGGAIAGFEMTHPLKLQYIPGTRVENVCAGGIDAFRNACFAVACGEYDIALVIGSDKLKESGVTGLPFRPVGASGDHPVFEVGGTPPGAFALMATRYFHEYGATRETLAKIAVKNRHNGCLSPKAHFQKEVTIKEVLESPMIAWPLSLFDCCPVTDGAAAAIICPAEKAKNFRDDYVLVKALGLSVSAGKPQNKHGFDFLGFPATVGASKQAYEQAGIKNPAEEIDIALVHDSFTITELLSYEDLGFCKKGKAKESVDSGAFTMDGKLPVNTDGGLLSYGHPQSASGLRMMYELYKQLQGKADSGRQLKNVKMGLAHNVGDEHFNVSGVAILSIP